MFSLRAKTQPKQPAAGERRSIEARMLSELCSRLSLLCFTFGCAFGVYGVTSIDIFRMFAPEITAWQNTWPRLAFNALPFFSLALYLRKPKKLLRMQSIIGSVGVPAIFASACMVHAWPLIMAGNYELYLYVHGANVFVLTITLLIASAPPRLMALQIASFAVSFFAPLLFLLSGQKSHIILNLFANDFCLFVIVAGIFSHSIYKLRHNLAQLDERIRSQITPFIGSHVAGAIYDNRPELLLKRTTAGLVMRLDLRGYTGMIQSERSEISKQLMDDYHSLVSRSVGEYGAVMHKSIGDGHSISLGLMGSPDLKDIPGIESEAQSALERQRKTYFHLACQIFEEISRGLEEIQMKHGVFAPIRLGSAIDYGDVDTSLIGDANHRQEFDISGEIVIRCARLEAYTKLLIKVLEPDVLRSRSSFLVVSPSLEDEVAASGRDFEDWETRSEGRNVRDFPAIQKLHFLRLHHATSTTVAARAAA